MSLESAADEERREVMNILEGRTTHNSPSIASGFRLNERTSSPAPPVRSMLDIGPDTAPRHVSIAGPAAGVSAPLRSAPLVRSMLDPYSPPPTRITYNTAGSSTTVVDPTLTEPGLHRAQSDASAHPPSWRQRAGSDQQRGGGMLPYADNQFDMSSTVKGQALPKRVTQGGKKSLGLNSMASILQGQELEPLPRAGDQGRHNSTAGIIGAKSRSPSSRINHRSQSPGGSMLNTNSFNLMPAPNTFTTYGGKVIDLNNAYRRLSDANLLKSGGHLSSLPVKSANERNPVGSGETLSPTGEVRLQKDYYRDHEAGEAAIETSDEAHSTDEDAWNSTVRGRRKARRKKELGGGASDTEDSTNDKHSPSKPPPVIKTAGPAGMGRSGGPRMARSLLGAAEEERKTSSACFHKVVD